eukprot:Pgem_evm1s11117
MCNGNTNSVVSIDPDFNQKLESIGQIEVTEMPENYQKKPNNNDSLCKEVRYPDISNTSLEQ